MAAAVYILCALTSGLCAFLLLRNARKAAGRLLYWSGLAFVCFTAGNILLFLDLAVFPQVDLLFWRNTVNMVGVALLLFGLIWESD